MVEVSGAKQQKLAKGRHRSLSKRDGLSRKNILELTGSFFVFQRLLLTVVRSVFYFGVSGLKLGDISAAGWTTATFKLFKNPADPTLSLQEKNKTKHVCC